MRTALLVLVLACKGDKHQLPKVEGDKVSVTVPTTPPASPAIDTTTVAGRLRAMFGATQSPDTSGAIAKLEASSAAMPKAERELATRAIAIARLGDVVMKEPDRLKSRPLQVQLMRETITLLDEMSALDPDDLEVQAMVSGSFSVLASNVQSIELADEIDPKMLRARARAISERTRNVHPTVAKAWLMHAHTTPHDDPLTRLRSLAKCLKLEPASPHCKEMFDEERTAYLMPYCDGADIRGEVSWRAASKTPSAGSTQVEHHYETIHLAAAPKFTIEDVIRIQATRSRTDYHEDGKVTTRMHDGVHFELPPAKLDAMIAWSRELEKRGDLLAVMNGGKLLFTDQRAMFDDSRPSIVGVKIDEYCVKTKLPALPADL
jgi:hypothetical protein